MQSATPVVPLEEPLSLEEPEDDPLELLGPELLDSELLDSEPVGGPVSVPLDVVLLVEVELVVVAVPEDPLPTVDEISPELPPSSPQPPKESGIPIDRPTRQRVVIRVMFMLEALSCERGSSIRNRIFNFSGSALR